MQEYTFGHRHLLGIEGLSREDIEHVLDRADAYVELSRQTNHQVQFKADGYLSAQREISRDVNPWVWANILIGGIPGLIVDSATGAYNDLTPDVVAVDLVPDPNHTAHQKDAESAVKDTREIK